MNSTCLFSPVLAIDMLQIRIVTDVSNGKASDTNGVKKSGKKKKPHRGYAFVVFEREKDMKGMYH